ncbi:DUF6189 family protein [Streptomyces sp. NPDC004111]|uniref:DUF6189 family protein n=1 Tax=Streptomyces sp. NPDC004111 TaxID=3364690 RepID=UPI0036A41EC2
MEPGEFAKRTGQVVERLAPKLPAQHAASMRGANGAGEWLIALDTLVGSLAEKRIPVSPEDYRDLRLLLEHLTSSASASVRYDMEPVLACLLRDVLVLRRPRPTDVGAMDEAEASGQVWREEVRMRPSAAQDRDTLARLVDTDASDFEVELYERAADPQVLAIDRAQHSHAGQHARHVRRIREREQRQDD